MILRLLLLALILSSAPAYAELLCMGGISSMSARTGYCMVRESAAVTVTPEQIASLEGSILFYKTRFPQMMEKIRANGFHRIVMMSARPSQGGVKKLIDLDTEKKLLLVYPNYFEVTAANAVPSIVKFPAREIFLFHEFVHAFDHDFKIVDANLKIIGWESSDSDAPADNAANIWLLDRDIQAIETQVNAAGKLSDWQRQILAREGVKKFGYPSLYAARGGAVESFAELGAYIAFDPEAASYVRPETLKWFQKNILK